MREVALGPVLLGLVTGVEGAPLYVHDPAVAKQDTYYYVFGTAQGISIRRTRDFRVWEYVGSVFGRAPEWAYTEVPGFNGHLWAPDISFAGGRYLLYYSVSTFGSNRSRIGVAVNATLDPKDPGYGWVDLGMVVSSMPGRDNFNAIDPNLFVDTDGRWYLSFGSLWGGIQQVELNPQTGKPARDPPRFAPMATRPRVQYDPIEAPFLIHRQGHYYLFVSFDLCCRGVRSTYRIALGRADNVAGPYVDRAGVPMLEGGGTILVEGSGDDHEPGHNAVLEDGGRDLLLYHTYDATRGGQAVLRVRPLLWSADGWSTAGDVMEGL
jgi:arabinan endo-1,5-alpha-L-arabinosidase